MSEPLSEQELRSLIESSVADFMIHGDLYINELFGIPEKENIFEKYYRIYKKINECIAKTLRCVKKAGFVDESLASSILEDKNWMPDDVNIIQNWYNNCTEEDRIDKLLVSAYSHILHALSQLTYAEIVSETPDDLREDHRDIEDCYAQFECYLRKSVFATTWAVKWIFAGSSNSKYVVAGWEQALECKLSSDPETAVQFYLGLAPKRNSV